MGKKKRRKGKQPKVSQDEVDAAHAQVRAAVASGSPAVVLGATRDLARAAGSRELVGGQVDDLAFAPGGADEESRVEAVHLRKTAALMAASITLGARFGGLGADGADDGCRGSADFSEEPDCLDGLTNDADIFIDYDGGAAWGLPLDQQTDPDPGCRNNPIRRQERSSCGLGFEAALLMPALVALRIARRRRR